MAFGGDRVIAPVPVTPAGFALFLDVTDFAAGRHFSIAADDAAARESGEPEKSNKAHDVFKPLADEVSKPRTAESIVIVTFTHVAELSPSRAFSCTGSRPRFTDFSARLDLLVHAFGY